MMGRRRPRMLGGWVSVGAVSLLLWGGSADGAPQRRDAGPLFTQIDTGQGAAAAARALAAKGDCAHALASFDTALHSSIDMTIRRDRGLCHEQLGDPFPAMDDYRAYLTVSPDAPDSADIRARLERLETQTGVGGPSQLVQTKSEDVPDEPAQVGDTSIQTSDTGKRSGAGKGYNYDAEENAYKKYDQAMTSPLRRGTGGIFGVYGSGIALAGLGPVGTTFVGGYELGASVGWSISQVSAFYGHIGYAGYQIGSLGSATTAGGLALAIGYEARIRLDQYATNAIVVGPAFEYQYIAESNVGVGVNLLIPKGRVGYRLVLGKGFGLAFLFDVGEPIILLSSCASPAPCGASRDPLVGGTMELLLGF